MKIPFLNIGGTRRVQETPPPGVTDFLTYQEQEGAGGTDAAHFVPADVPSLDDPTFPTLGQQSDILTHWYRPPAWQNPQEWYDDKAVWTKQQRENIERQNAVPVDIITNSEYQAAPDPRWTPPPINRPTTDHKSPSSYRFERPFDQERERELSGLHLSLASSRTAYQLYGTVGQQRGWNNSFRLDPPTNDQRTVFVGDTVVDGGTLVAAMTGGIWSSNAYRLDT